MAHGAVVYGKGVITGSADDSLEGAFRIAIAQKPLQNALKESFSWKNMKGGVISFAANLAIGVISDRYENIQEDMAIKESGQADEKDVANSISVIAVKV